MKKAFLFLFMVLAVSLGLLADDLDVIGVITEPIKPRFLAVDEHQIYIAEPTTVHIYTQAGFKKVTQFGKAGSGPEEFMAAQGGGSLFLIPYQDQLIVSAMGKLNYYKKNGSFIKTVKIEGASMMAVKYLPLNTGYIGPAMGKGDDEKMVAFTTSIFDSSFKSKKVVNRTLLKAGSSQFNIFDMIRRMTYTTDRSKICCISDDDKAIDIYSENGAIIRNIAVNSTKVPVTKGDIDAFFTSMTKNGVSSAQVDALKKMFIFPEFYPLAMDLFIDNNIVYLTTWKKKGDDHLVLVYDSQTGSLLKEMYVPIQNMTGITPYPFTYHKGQFFSIVELPDEDEPDEVIYSVVRKKLL